MFYHTAPLHEVILEKNFSKSVESLTIPTCNNIEAPLPLDKADIVGYEGSVCVRLHAGMSGLQQLHAPAAVSHDTGPDVRHGSRDGRHCKTRHCVQLCYHLAQRLQGVHITWWGSKSATFKRFATGAGACSL